MNEHVAQPFRGILDSVLTVNERAVLAGHEQMRSDLGRLRAVWRAVAEEMRVAGFDLPDSIRNAAVDTGLAGDGPGDMVTVLTPDGERLARGEA